MKLWTSNTELEASHLSRVLSRKSLSIQLGKSSCLSFPSLYRVLTRMPLVGKIYYSTFQNSTPYHFYNMDIVKYKIVPGAPESDSEQVWDFQLYILTPSLCGLYKQCGITAN